MPDSSCSSSSKVEDVSAIKGEIPGRVRFPIRSREIEYRNKHREAFHEHFDRVSEAGIRLLEREPFQHLIIGGLWEVLPQLESRLHRYLRDRIVARWDVDVQHAPRPRSASGPSSANGRTWSSRRRRSGRRSRTSGPPGGLGSDEVFTALWARRVGARAGGAERVAAGVSLHVMLTAHAGRRPVRRVRGEGGAVSDAFAEAVQDAIEQDAHLRYWNDPALTQAGSLAALKRF